MQVIAGTDLCYLVMSSPSDIIKQQSGVTVITKSAHSSALWIQSSMILMTKSIDGVSHDSVMNYYVKILIIIQRGWTGGKLNDDPITGQYILF